MSDRRAGLLSKPKRQTDLAGQGMMGFEAGLCFDLIIW
jgi:hypothetical protein